MSLLAFFNNFLEQEYKLFAYIFFRLDEAFVPHQSRKDLEVNCHYGWLCIRECFLLQFLRNLSMFGSYWKRSFLFPPTVEICGALLHIAKLALYDDIVHISTQCISLNPFRGMTIQVDTSLISEYSVDSTGRIVID